MRGSSVFLCSMFLVFCTIGSSSANIIQGVPTLGDPYTAAVTSLDSEGRFGFYIPLSGSDETFGDSGFGLSPDTVYAPITGPYMNMYLYFLVPDGQIADALTLTFTDLDLTPYNDPDGFFESIEFYGQGGLPSDTFSSYNDPDFISAVVAASDVESTLSFTGLNIASGDFWLHLTFNAWSDFDCGRWTNTIEYLDAELSTSPVPEPATMLLLGSGLLGLAAFSRRKLREN